MGDFFRVLDLKPIAGRLPTASETHAGAPLIVVSERVAQGYWPGTSAIGETMLGPVRGVSGQQAHTVIGVVPEVRWFAWDVASPMIYGPYRTPAATARSATTRCPRCRRGSPVVAGESARHARARAPLLCFRCTQMRPMDGRGAV
jgi:hypothetical protein